MGGSKAVMVLLLLFGATVAKGGCGGGSVADCEEGEELMLDSIINRRLLQTTTSTTSYISYEALSADRTPCPAGSGYSYYTNNCQSTNATADPTARGCSTITRCARDTSDASA